MAHLGVSAAYGHPLGQPFPEQSEELRLEASVSRRGWVDASNAYKYNITVMDPNV